MEVPESVRIGITNIRDTFSVSWNPQAHLVRPGHYDATGGINHPPVYDGRFELWDRTPEGVPYKVMTLQYPDRSFRPPGQWLVDLLNQVNPAKWGGDPRRMIAHFVDHPEELREKVADQDFDDFAEMAARWADYARKTKSRVMTDNCQPALVRSA